MRHKRKSINQRIHAKRRFLERYGMTFSTRDLDAIVSQIKTGQASFISRQSLRVTIWDVFYCGTLMRVVYDKNTKNIVTVFPHETQAEGPTKETNQNGTDVR